MGKNHAEAAILAMSVNVPDSRHEWGTMPNNSSQQCGPAVTAKLRVQNCRLGNTKTRGSAVLAVLKGFQRQFMYCLMIQKQFW